MVTVKDLDKKRIVQAITAAERLTSGEIRVHVTDKCRLEPQAAAKKVFEKLRMHRTAERNGVLIFVSLKERAFAVIGDRGIHEKVGQDFWVKVRDRMAAHFSSEGIEEGILAGIGEAGQVLGRHFPRNKDDRNELSDEVTLG